MGAPTQKDVAERARVSVATVSYVLSGRRDRTRPSSPAVVARVRQAAEELGYRPSRAARSLRSRRTRLVAVAHHLPLSPWTIEVMEQFDEVAAEHGYHQVTIPYRPDATSLDRMEELLTDGLADANVLFAHPSVTADRLARLVASGGPLLVVGNRDAAGANVLWQDQAAAVRQAVHHLVGSGCRRILCLRTDAHDTRADTFAETMRELGHPDPWGCVRTVDWHAPTTVRSPDLTAHHVLAEADPPDAMLATADRVAISLLWAALNRGIPVPDELRIIGMGNIEGSADTIPPLTTLGVDRPDYRPPMRHLLRRIDDPDVEPRTFELLWTLIRRASA